jgi:HECT-like Ubiquitin-conjugating enzyme (E2)-binding
VHRFLLHCPSDPIAPIFHIWVFQPRITISIPARPAPFPATKIYFTTPSADSVSTLLQNSSKLTSAVGEIRLPADVMHELAVTLNASTLALPPSVRGWKEWQIGFLERWAEE